MAELAVSWQDLVGVSFIQGGVHGVASYHFGHEHCFISYENAPPAWRLASGAAPPARKPFFDPVYDAATRTFTAWVDWSADNFGGSARWEYSFTFNAALTMIESGHVLSYNAQGALHRVSHYGLNDAGDMGLLYVRASEPAFSLSSPAA